MSSSSTGEDSCPIPNNVPRKDITLLLIYVNIALYATCFQIQRPLEPFLVERIGLNRGDHGGMEYARLQSFFSVMQTVGSLVAGTFLDRCGPKGGFIVSFIASAASYYLLSISTTIELLYLSKIPTIFQAGFLCAQLAASQATSDGEERVKALGRLTLSYTIGSVLGPAIGGTLGASGDYYYGAKLAVGGSLLSVVLTLLMPSTNTTAAPHSDDPSSTVNKNHRSEATPMKFTAVLASILGIIKIVWLLLGTKVVTSIANSMSGTAFPLILKNIYSLDEQSLGYSMSAMSAFNGVVNGLFLGPIVALAGGQLPRVISVCIAAMAALSAVIGVVGVPGFAVLSYRGGLYEFLGLTFILSMFQYVLSTTITGESTAIVKPTEKGTLLGLEHALFAAARIAAPQAGILLLDWGGVTAVSACCSAIFLGVLFTWNAYSSKVDLTGKVSEKTGERKER